MIEVSSKRLAVLMTWILLLPLAGCSTRPAVTYMRPPRRVLFIGSSYTYYNNGVDHDFEELAKSASPSTPLSVGQRTLGSAYLMIHYENLGSMKAIREGGWDVVILQGYSTEPIDEQMKEISFVKHARLLDEEIRRTGARTVLFMTWADERDPGMTEPVAEAYLAVGNDLGAFVVPVGLAWERALQQRPTLKLHSDGRHPTPAGTYLSACVFYASLMGESPVGLSYTADIPEQESVFLQSVAWETARAFYRW